MFSIYVLLYNFSQHQVLIILTVVLINHLLSSLIAHSGTFMMLIIQQVDGIFETAHGK